jgi:hypothetical protein
MKISSAIVFALAMTAAPALANVTVPSAQNSGVGIPSFAGTEAGPAVQPGTVGLAAGPYNLSVREQDASHIPGLPGAEAGASVKPASRLS